ncbi:MAG: preprotein translocase subunit YajC [Nitrospirota bacterium]|nr:preprotein translocase subunit YajC [Nitrospirota bacterium]
MPDWSQILLPATAFAQGAEGAQPGGPAAFLGGMVPFIVIFGLFWLLLMRPQQKRQKEHRQLIEGLQKGDKVVTTGGLLGTVMNVHSDIVSLQIAEGVRVKILRAEVMVMQGDLGGEGDSKD